MKSPAAMEQAAAAPSSEATLTGANENKERQRTASEPDPEMIKQAAAAYSRLLQTTDTPISLAEFVTIYFDAQRRCDEESKRDGCEDKAEKASAQSADATQGPGDTKSAHQRESSAQSRHIAMTSMMAPSSSDNTIKADNGVEQELFVGSDMSIAGFGPSNDAGADLSWPDLSNSMISSANTSISSNGAVTPNDSLASWAQTRSNQTSTTSLASYCSMGRAADALAAYASLGSPMKTTPSLADAFSRRTDGNRPMSGQSQGLRSRGVSPTSARATPEAGLPFVFTSSNPPVTPGLPSHMQFEMRSNSSSNISPHSSIGDISGGMDWTSISAPRMHPGFDMSGSPSAATSMSEPMRSRSSTVASSSGRPTPLSRHGSMHQANSPCDASSSTSSLQKVPRTIVEYGGAAHESRLESTASKRVRTELKRRNDISASFEDLKHVLGMPGRMIKVQILDKAGARILELEKENESIRVAHQQQSLENAQLRQRLQIMQEQLGKGILQPPQHAFASGPFAEQQANFHIG